MTHIIYAPGCSYFQLYTLIQKKITSSDKAYFYFAFASNMSKIASGTESLRAEHRGNDPRNWPIYFQCPCRHIRHDLYMIHKQSVDKEQSKSTRGHRTSEKKKSQVSLFLFGFRTTLTPIYIHLIPSRRSRKEVFQPHLPVRLPCYDLAPITSFALGRPSR